MIRSTGLFLALALLGGCAAPDVPQCEGRFHAHRTLSVEDQGAVARAFAKWNELAGRPVLTLEAGDPDKVTCSVRVDETTGDLGLWVPTDGAISVAPARMRDTAPGCASRMRDCVEAVVLHEAGHALGLEHSTAAGASVMAADGELVLEFASVDREQCRAVGVCL